MSAEVASDYVHRLVNIEQVSSGTKETALSKIARDYGFGISQLVHLYKRRAKTCDADLFVRIQRAYLDRCDRMVTVT